MQIGLGLAEAEGAEGVRFTVTATVPEELVHPLVVAVTEYVPPAAVVPTASVGFWEVEVKLFGPVQLYVVPVGLADKLSVAPVQIGLGLAEAAGAAGVRFTVTATVPAALVHPLVVAVTEYVPPAAVEPTAREGF